MTINTQGKKVPLESVAAEFENVAVELQAVTGDLKGMLQTILDFEKAYDGIRGDEEISSESILAFVRMSRSVKQSSNLMAELERISSEANAILHVLDNQTA